MKRRILIGIILISLIASFLVTIGRYRVEQASPEVEIVLDWISFENFQRQVKKPFDQLLQKFKDAGVTSVGIYEKDIFYYVKNNNMMLIRGQDLAQQYFLSKEMDPALKSLYQGLADRDNIFLLFKDEATYNKIYKLIQDLPDIITSTYKDHRRSLYIIKVEDGDTGILTLPLGFSNEEVQMVTEVGLKLVPRVSNTEKRLAILPDILKDLKNNGEISKVIFSGYEVLGYPDRLAETAQILHNQDISVGMIEPFIADQKGIKKLATLLNMDIVRVHSIQQGEVDKYSYEKVLDRYIRAVKERNVRVLYYKPFSKAKDNLKPMELNQRFLKDLREGLIASGYQIGIAKPFPNQRTGISWIIIISLGIFAAGLLLTHRFISFPDWLDYSLLALGVIIILVLTLKGYVLLTRELLALLAAVVLPSLAIIEGYKMTEEKVDVKGKIITKAILIFIKITAITLVGVFFIIGILSDVRYLYQVNQFRGIKITFILPLLIVGLYYLKRLYEVEKPIDYLKMIKGIFKSLNQPVRYSHLVIMGFVGIAGLIYIGRTGNFPVLPIPGWELKLRAFLEDLLVYRPRFKEFAIGHPFMLLTLVYMLSGNVGNRKGKLLLPLLIIGSIGQLTIINTFTHIHTPVIVSTVRVFYGIVLGIFLGLILIWVFHWLMELMIRLRGWIYE
ncbi:hypothetical protein BBF96_01560 [Anoxybacter fermentans]|uniref:Beta-carotene 15,15'-monooxygenase n=1 Tax=Anoxybacter fermentans TaxID=1323375 RepID=A0A3S9SV59_9FIRM|nr:DUF5693 family protein [Anoxybacter fermentans]AZR72196.1 hypothetical protein BBF96_01560 [Anoxybacter fermentans]